MNYIDKGRIMNKFLKSALAVCAIVPCAFTFGACGDKHQHKYSSEWSASETHHWHGTNCGHGNKDSYGEHDYTNDWDMFCDVCGYDRAEYSAWNGEIPTEKPNSFDYDMQNRLIFLNDATAFAYFAWAYDMNDDYEVRVQELKQAKNNNELDNYLVRDESEDENENCFANSLDWTIVLNANIDLDNHTVEPIQNFNYRGFIGRNHVIKNFTISNTQNTATGLFGQVSNYTSNGVGFSDFTIKHATIVSTTIYPSGIIGETNMPISNVHAIDVEVIGNAQYVGAICGRSYSSVTNCSAKNIEITGTEYIGGVVGKVQSDEGAGALEIDNLYVENAKITNQSSVDVDKIGAIVGCVEVTSTSIYDSLTVFNTNYANNTKLMNNNNKLNFTLIGLNKDYTCIIFK
jgi:hypothetical protein